MIARPAVAVISAAILAYEVLLVRLFAIVQWHHFAFMAISVALLGFGVSGALLAIARRRAAGREAGLFTLSAILFATSAPAAFLGAQHLPFNALAVVWEPTQLVFLGAIFLLLAVPFTAGASCIGLAFLAGGGAAGRVYLWNLVGSGAGAAGIVAALSAISPIACLWLVGGTGAAAAALGEIARGRLRALGMIVGGMALAALAAPVAPPSATALHISEFKDLPRALAVGGARLAREYSGPLALVSVVESPAVPFRYAPGLSLLAPALPPPQLGVFADGGFAGAIDLWDGAAEALGYLDHSTDALAYHLVRRPTVLVLGAGGGRLVLQAIGRGAERIDAVELNPQINRLVTSDFADRAGRPYGRPEVAVAAGDPRRFVTASARQWELIQLPLLDAGAGAAARGLRESYLSTAEAFALIYGRLAPAGWLSVTVPLDLPPRAAPKLIATLRAALAGQGIADPAGRIIAIRGMTTVTVLAKRAPVGAADIAAAKAFAAARAFDLVHYPGMAAAEANRHNVLAAPVFHEAAGALLGTAHQAYIDRYKFDIAPATDDRPYFHDYFRWATLPELVALGAGGGAALIELGELIVAATLVQAVVLSALLILLPLRARAFRGKPSALAWRYGVYFAALGLAFLFVEIVWIQKFVLFLGHPLYAVSVALTGFLVFAGLGAGASSRLERLLARRRLNAISVAVVAITVLSLGYLAALPPVLAAAAGLPDALRVALALALIAPLAFFMGMPFPLGLTRVAGTDPEFVPWAWGLNGCASVIGAAGATLLTMNLGFSATVVIAIAIYLVGARFAASSPCSASSSAPAC